MAVLLQRPVDQNGLDRIANGSTEITGGHTQ